MTIPTRPLKLHASHVNSIEGCEALFQEAELFGVAYEFQQDDAVSVALRIGLLIQPQAGADDVAIEGQYGLNPGGVFYVGSHLDPQNVYVFHVGGYYKLNDISFT
jgi:hypothetical protein